ncbi:MAG: DUF3450 family protein [Myxococcota bacterium]
MRLTDHVRPDAPAPRKRGRTLVGAGLAALATCFLVPALAVGADDDLSNLAERLIQLRGDVEGLNDDIESQQQEHRNRMSSLTQRRAELDAQIQRQELEIKKLEREITEIQAEATGVSAEIATLEPLVKDATKRLEQRIEASLPYQTFERTADLQEVLRKLDADEISAARALNNIWTFFEDELRLSRESEMFRQTIEVEGEEQLADVVRLGMVMLFFKTGDERYGFATRQGSQWNYQVASGSDRSRIEELFAAFEKQVRTGFFVIPNALQGAQ